MFYYKKREIFENHPEQKIVKMSIERIYVFEKITRISTTR